MSQFTVMVGTSSDGEIHLWVYPQGRQGCGSALVLQDREQLAHIRNTIDTYLKSSTPILGVTRTLNEVDR